MGKSQSLEIETGEIPTPRRGGPPPQYLDLDKLKNADGIVAIISQRLSNRVITFALFKEFERDRRSERTSFVAESLRESYQQMVTMTFERIDQIHNVHGVMEKLQLDAIGKLDAEDAAHCRKILGIRARGSRS